MCAEGHGQGGNRVSRFEELPKELPDLIFRSLSGDITEPEFRRLDEILSQS